MKRIANKKSIIMTLAVMTLIMMLLASCSGGGESSSDDTSADSSKDVLAGKTYEYVSLQNDGKDVEIQKGLKGRKLTFNDDGTVLLAGYRDDENQFSLKDMTGTYTVDGNNLTIVMDWQPDSIEYDDPELASSQEDQEETPVEDRTEHAIIDGDDLNFSMDITEYDDNGNETGNKIHQTWVYSLVK